MNDVTIPLDEDVARAIILAVAHTSMGYNKSWQWWAMDATESKVYDWGNARIILVQNTRSSVDEDSYGSYSTAEVELVWEISTTTNNEWNVQEDEVRFFRIKGEFSSYGGDEWSDTSFREVKPTTRTYREYI